MDKNIPRNRPDNAMRVEKQSLIDFAAQHPVVHYEDPTGEIHICTLDAAQLWLHAGYFTSEMPFVIAPPGVDVMSGEWKVWTLNKLIELNGRLTPFVMLDEERRKKEEETINGLREELTDLNCKKRSLKKEVKHLRTRLFEAQVQLQQIHDRFTHVPIKRIIRLPPAHRPIAHVDKKIFVAPSLVPDGGRMDDFDVGDHRKSIGKHITISQVEHAMRGERQLPFDRSGRHQFVHYESPSGEIHSCSIDEAQLLLHSGYFTSQMLFIIAPMGVDLLSGEWKLWTLSKLCEQNGQSMPFIICDEERRQWEVERMRVINEELANLEKGRRHYRVVPAIDSVRYRFYNSLCTRLITTRAKLLQIDHRMAQELADLEKRRKILPTIDSVRDLFYNSLCARLIIARAIQLRSEERIGSSHSSVELYESSQPIVSIKISEDAAEVTEESPASPFINQSIHEDTVYEVIEKGEQSPASLLLNEQTHEDTIEEEIEGGDEEVVSCDEPSMPLESEEIPRTIQTIDFSLLNNPLLEIDRHAQTVDELLSRSAIEKILRIEERSAFPLDGIDVFSILHFYPATHLWQDRVTPYVRKLRELTSQRDKDRFRILVDHLFVNVELHCCICDVRILTFDVFIIHISCKSHVKKMKTRKSIFPLEPLAFWMHTLRIAQKDAPWYPSVEEVTVAYESPINKHPGNTGLPDEPNSSSTRSLSTGRDVNSNFVSQLIPGRNGEIHIPHLKKFMDATPVEKVLTIERRHFVDKSSGQSAVLLCAIPINDINPFEILNFVPGHSSQEVDRVTPYTNEIRLLLEIRDRDRFDALIKYISSNKSYNCRLCNIMPRKGASKIIKHIFSPDHVKMMKDRKVIFPKGPLAYWINVLHMSQKESEISPSPRVKSFAVRQSCETSRGKMIGELESHFGELGDRFELCGNERIKLLRRTVPSTAPENTIREVIDRGEVSVDRPVESVIHSLPNVTFHKIKPREMQTCRPVESSIVRPLNIPVFSLKNWFSPLFARPFGSSNDSHPNAAVLPLKPNITPSTSDGTHKSTAFSVMSCRPDNAIGSVEMKIAKELLIRMPVEMILRIDQGRISPVNGIDPFDILRFFLAPPGKVDDTVTSYAIEIHRLFHNWDFLRFFNLVSHFLANNNPYTVFCKKIGRRIPSEHLLCLVCKKWFSNDLCTLILHIKSGDHVGQMKQHNLVYPLGALAFWMHALCMAQRSEN